MPDANDDLKLAADFAPASYDDWRKLVDGVLKGTSFEKLVSKTYDGLRIEPIYPRAHGAAPIAGRAEAAPWQIMQRIDHPDAAKANAQALHDLENGANGLTLIFAGANGARGFGLEPSAGTIEKLLGGVFIDAGIAIELNIGPQSRMAAVHLAEFIRQKEIDPSKCDIRFGLDPIGACAVWGSSAYNWWEITPAFTDAIKKLAAQGFKGPFAVADGRVIHDAGGSEVQELAYVLAVGVAYLRALEGADVGLNQAREMIYARLSADADQFLTLAKFRALRLLWARIEQSCGLAPKPFFIAADTAWRMLTQRDPSVNMLRATMAVFSAGLGGADSINVLPHTLALGLPDAFARRVARNTQLVLLEESNLAKVSDPAAGAGGIEALTRQLCEAAWAQFQEIEKAGGAFFALGNNVIQPKVAATRAARQASIARRREVLTGASEFPNLHEARAAVLKAKPVKAEPYGKPKIKFAALEPIRLAAPFEALRDKSDHLLARAGARPKIFLANLGTPADFTARATFAKSFFETGGIEAVDYLPSPSSSPLPSGEGALTGGRNPSPAPSPSAQERPLPMGEVKEELAALAAAFKSSGAALACLCSSDKVYADQAAAAAKALQAAGARHIYLAGRPGEQETAWRDAGVQDFIFAGGDALATLSEAYQRMG
ncbi:MAG: Methylmalonyl-CoA mutase [Tardiphaga sp.]|jgi:methylmalonyl-CoA mutase|nr:Methylmalonyl-CoA mutase [Tardiphaga sp.]